MTIVFVKSFYYLKLFFALSLPCVGDVMQSPPSVQDDGIKGNGVIGGATMRCQIHARRPHNA